MFLMCRVGPKPGFFKKSGGWVGFNGFKWVLMGLRGFNGFFIIIDKVTGVKLLSFVLVLLLAE